MYKWSRQAIVSNVLFRGWVKPKWKALLTSILNPIKLVHDDFLAYRERKNRFVRINFQVIYLEQYLNKEHGITYDLSLRDSDISNKNIFYIENTAVRDTYPVYQINEGIQEVELFWNNEEWDNTATYNTDGVVTRFDSTNNRTKVFLADVDGLSTDPLVDTSTNWKVQKDEMVLNTLEDDKAVVHFIVKVPTSYHNFSQTSEELNRRFRKELDLKIANYLHVGKVYTVENY